MWRLVLFVSAHSDKHEITLHHQKRCWVLASFGIRRTQSFPRKPFDFAHGPELVEGRESTAQGGVKKSRRRCKVLRAFAALGEARCGWSVGASFQGFQNGLTPLLRPTPPARSRGRGMDRPFGPLHLSKALPKGGAFPPFHKLQRRERSRTTIRSDSGAKFENLREPPHVRVSFEKPQHAVDVSVLQRYNITV